MQTQIYYLSATIRRTGGETLAHHITGIAKPDTQTGILETRYCVAHVKTDYIGHSSIPASLRHCKRLDRTQIQTTLDVSRMSSTARSI